MNFLKTGTLAAALALGLNLQAAELSLQAAPGDLIPTTLLQPKSAALPGSAESEPVHFAWALDTATELAAPQPYRADSREFWTQLDASQAKRGFAFDVGSEGALVRISPQQGAKAGTLSLDQIELRVDGRMLPTAAAIENLADEAQLKAAGAHFSSGTLVFQLSPGLAGRRLQIALPKASGGALLHVLEPNSPVAMQLSADALGVGPGQPLRLTARFDDAGRTLSAERVAGLVTAPDGRSFPVEFKLDASGIGHAEFTPPADAEGGLEPWEVHAFGRSWLGKAEVLRDARTGFSVHRPSARLQGQASLKAGADGLRILLPAETAAAGRYELRGTLHGTDASGTLRPLAIAHSAQRVEAGQTLLELRFPADVLGRRLAAPYELRDLSLSDQSRHSLSERRARALVMPTLPQWSGSAKALPAGKPGVAHDD